MATQGVRLSEFTLTDARREAGIMSRTVSAQVEHWIRLGRAIERAPAFDDRAIKSALRGEISPDALDAYERAIYDVEHEELMRTAGDNERDFYRRLAKRQTAAGVTADELGD